ncbi:MAG: sigma 54-interacting transcriptional regulator [Bacteriovoracia bacterium]
MDVQTEKFNPQVKSSTQLKLLNEISTKLQSLMGSDNFHQEVLSIIRNYFNYYSLQYWSPHGEDGAQLEAQLGAYGNHIRVGHVIRGRQAGITGHVIRTKKSYLTNDVSTDSNFTNLSFPVNSQSELCVPLVKDDQIFGTLNVESDSKNAFDENDVITLEAVASQLAVAVSNRKLFSETRDFSLRLQKAVDDKTVELRKAHERILQQQKLLQRENKALKTMVNQENQNIDTIGQSPAILSTLTMVDKIAPTTATVLIQGESGTGKELIARRLHFKSDRAGNAYVTVNCGALQESLLESELFGHEKGAFTGAVGQKIGLVETADGGTLFLDEIGEMSLGIQAKLLRFLQDGEFYRIGGKKPMKVDVRVVSATNRDLELEVKENRFREDLFYRMNTITLRMPPLRKRKEDIPMLVEYFLKNSRFGSSTQIKRVDPRVMDVLKNYDWPGNIRELQNTIERMKILSENHEIRLDDIPFGIRSPRAGSTKDGGAEYNASMPLEELEKSHILKALDFNHGNKTKTAQSLGITIKTLYNKLYRYGAIKAPGQGNAPGIDGLPAET